MELVLSLSCTIARFEGYICLCILHDSLCWGVELCVTLNKAHWEQSSSEQAEKTFDCFADSPSAPLPPRFKTVALLQSSRWGVNMLTASLKAAKVVIYLLSESCHCNLKRGPKIEHEFVYWPVIKWLVWHLPYAVTSWHLLANNILDRLWVFNSGQTDSPSNDEAKEEGAINEIYY